jgi:two-component system sensor histidine kinase BarA
LKQLKFEHRKVVHYSLLAAIILLQIIAIVTWYNETKLSEAFDGMESAGKLNRINSALVLAQTNFNNYIANKDEISLQNYSKGLDEISAMLDSLPLTADNSKAKAALIKNKNKTQEEITRLKTGIDSIIDKQSAYKNEFPKAFRFSEFETKKFLDDVKTNSYVKVDSATRKGLFSRLGDAIANRTNVQKEYVNTVVTMEYKNKLTTGNVEQQLANAVAITNDYYADEFGRLKKSFSSLRTNDLKLMDLNNQLLGLTQNITSDYLKNSNLLQPNAQQQLADQYKSNKTVRSFSIIILIFLMLIVSVILFNFTRVAFEYEKRLTLAQYKIRESLNFKNRITGMISHEIRSPLSIIAMYSKKAGTSAKEPELKETFKSIEFTTNSLLLLSNQILEYSKEDNYELTLKPKSVNLKEEIQQILEAMTSLVETKGNTLEINSNLKAEDVVYTDVAKIHQLFYNLIGNANKFTENGHIKVDINLEPLSEYEMNFKTVISDNGIGIAETDLKNIFESYYQGTVSEKVSDLGVGLGLNICKEIIELFEGAISVESKPHSGTKVSFNLIIAQA